MNVVPYAIGMRSFERLREGLLKTISHEHNVHNALGRRRVGVCLGSVSDVS